MISVENFASFPICNELCEGLAEKMEMTRRASAQSQIRSQDFMNSQLLVVLCFPLHPKQLWRLYLNMQQYIQALSWEECCDKAWPQESHVRKQFSNQEQVIQSSTKCPSTGEAKLARVVARKQWWLDSVYTLDHESTQGVDMSLNFLCSSWDQFVRNTAWTPP